MKRIAKHGLIRISLAGLTLALGSLSMAHFGMNGAAADGPDDSSDYALFKPAASGDGSLMIAVWDVTNGATLVDKVGGLSFRAITSEPHGECENSIDANAKGIGQRNSSEFFVQRRLNGWDRFVEQSSGDVANYRYTVSAADDNPDCATMPSGTRPGTGFLSAYKGLAATSNEIKDITKIAEDKHFNWVDINDAARKHDEFFGSTGPRGFHDKDWLRGIWNGQTGVVNDKSNRRSVLYEGDPLPVVKPYDVMWASVLRYGRDESAAKPTRYGLNWGPYLGHEWKGPDKGRQAARIDDVVSSDMTGRIGEPLHFWLFTLGWGVVGANAELGSPIYAEGFDNTFKLSADGCLSYNASDCTKTQPYDRVEDWYQLPSNWVLGKVSAVTVDNLGHIWILHRPKTAELSKPEQRAAPAVLEFDESGELLQSWEVDGFPLAPGLEPLQSKEPHGITVDEAGHVWIALNYEHLVLKFTRSGEFLLSFGQQNLEGDNSDRHLLGGPADVAKIPNSENVYIADGYRNNRVAVIDGHDGEFKQAWGAYGRVPITPTKEDRDTHPLNSSALVGPVHGIAADKNGSIFVADRGGSRNGARVQEFSPDGHFLSQINLPAMDVAIAQGCQKNLLYIGGRSGTSGHTVSIVDEASRELLFNLFAEDNLLVHSLHVDKELNIYIAGLETGLVKYRPSENFCEIIKQVSSDTPPQ